MLIDAGQGTGYFKLKALGTVPTIDCDIRVIFNYSTDANIVAVNSAAAYAATAEGYKNQIASYAKIQRKTVTISSLSIDSSNTTYPYKYEVA